MPSACNTKRDHNPLLKISAWISNPVKKLAVVGPTGAGKSSFGLIDTAKFFQALELKKGVTFLDVACGRGNYSMAAAEIIGPNGRVFAIDLWEEGILSLRNEAAKKGIQHITSFVGDAGQRIPLENDSVDVCLMATVLHDFVGDSIQRDVYKFSLEVPSEEIDVCIDISFKHSIDQV